MTSPTLSLRGVILAATQGDAELTSLMGGPAAFTTRAPALANLCTRCSAMRALAIGRQVPNAATNTTQLSWCGRGRGVRDRRFWPRSASLA